ncbi:MAG: M48 family metallopeptidase [Bdellovibrionales bacterium]|nr:M48 family metallopeptidase [Bdellovibrionales bacterium]
MHSQESGIRSARWVAIVLTLLAFCSCSPARPKIPVGEIPDQGPPTVQEEQSGHEIFGQLVDRYPISRDNDQIFRVRDIVDRLTVPIHDPNRIWHVYLLEGSEVVNAAATKGNYIFVWTGLLEAVHSDDELATVLAHEIAHILSGHVRPQASDQMGDALSGIASETAQQAVYQVGGAVGVLAGLAGALTQLVFDAALVNPSAQAKEHEADQIGIFLMADACFDPSAAVEFWKRSPGGPDLGFLNVFSTHPNSSDRLESLEELLPIAQKRYRENPLCSGNRSTANGGNGEAWEVVERTELRIGAEESAQVIQVVEPTTQLHVVRREGQWLFVSSPVEGFIYGPKCSPITVEND